MADRRRRTGFVLVELLLVVAIIALLLAGYYGLSNRPAASNEVKQSVPARSIQKAKSVECANNLNQLRQLIQIEVIETGEYPQQFNPGSQGGIGTCPVSGKPYQYDPKTGRIWCTTPGHENL